SSQPPQQPPQQPPRLASRCGITAAEAWEQFTELRRAGPPLDSPRDRARRGAGRPALATRRVLGMRGQRRATRSFFAVRFFSPHCTKTPRDEPYLNAKRQDPPRTAKVHREAPKSTATRPRSVEPGPSNGPLPPPRGGEELAPPPTGVAELIEVPFVLWVG